MIAKLMCYCLPSNWISSIDIVEVSEVVCVVDFVVDIIHFHAIHVLN